MSMEQLELFVLTLSDAIDRYDCELATLFDEQYWEGGVNTDRALQLLEKWAESDGFEIIDTDDYDHRLFEFYHSCELGLS